MLIHGDSLEELKKMTGNSIDAVITDPPYGYSFMGKDWDKAVPSVETWKECLRVLKPGAFCMVMSAPRSDVQNAMISRLIEAGFRLDFTPIYWTYSSGFPKAGNIGKSVKKRFAGVEEDAKLANLEGSYAGFQPKPAVEVIIVAMKPLENSTYVDQAIENGHGVTWLDDARIPLDDNAYKDMGTFRNAYKQGAKYDGTKGSVSFVGKDTAPNVEAAKKGRFPANLLVSDDILNDGRNIASGGSVSGREPSASTNGIYGDYKTRLPYQSHKDSGSYSRYFDLDKWAEKLPFLIVSKASKTEKNEGLEPNTKNEHPTVKPLKLMSYLITLTTRQGEVVLDPFVGSGTTVLAAKKLGRVGIGIEKDEGYFNIATSRLEGMDANE